MWNMYQKSQHITNLITITKIIYTKKCQHTCTCSLQTRYNTYTCSAFLDFDEKQFLSLTSMSNLAYQNHMELATLLKDPIPVNYKLLQLVNAKM